MSAVPLMTRSDTETSGMSAKKSWTISQKIPSGRPHKRSTIRMGVAAEKVDPASQ